MFAVTRKCDTLSVQSQENHNLLDWLGKINIYEAKQFHFFQ